MASTIIINSFQSLIESDTGETTVVSFSVMSVEALSRIFVPVSSLVAHYVPNNASVLFRKRCASIDIVTPLRLFGKVVRTRGFREMP